MTITPETSIKVADDFQDFEDYPQAHQLYLIYQSQVANENKLDELIKLMSQIADATKNFGDSLPPPLRAMLGL